MIIYNHLHGFYHALTYKDQFRFEAFLNGS